MKSKRKDKSYKFVWPKINKKIEQAVLKQLRTSISIYDGGGILREFEKKFAVYHGQEFAVLCNSGTTAIHSMFVAADLKVGDEVICPAYTFFATVTPLLFTGAKPILCDCDENGNIDPKEIAKKITRRTKAVVVTHMWGIPAEMDKIVSICRKNKLLLLEDCSHAHGATYKNKIVGSFGNISAWSLQGAKIITGGEGGIMTTNNRAFFERALLLGHYNKRCRQEMDAKGDLYQYTHSGMGLKYRAHPLAIVIADKLFDDLKITSRFRSKYAASLIRDLRKIGSIGLPPAYFDKNLKPSWYSFIFFLKNGSAVAPYLRDILDRFKSAGLVDIDKPDSTIPLNLLPLFQNPAKLFPSYGSRVSHFAYRPGDFPKAESFYRSVLKMPVGVDQSDERLVNIYKKGIKDILSPLG